MELKVEDLGNTILIYISGEFYIGNIKKFEEVWNEQLKKSPKVIGLECSNLDFIDSSAIGTLVKFLNTANANDVNLVFYDLNVSIKSIFKTARLDNFFTIVTREEFEKNYL